MLNAILNLFKNSVENDYNFSTKHTLDELLQMIVSKDVGAAEELLQNRIENFDINNEIIVEGDRTTLLHVAVKRSSSAVVELLLKNGAETNCLNGNAHSAIVCATEHDVAEKLEKIGLLSAAGSNLDHFYIVANNDEIVAATRSRPNPYEKNSDGGFKLFDEVFGFTTDQMPWEFYERNRFILQAALQNGFDINMEDDLNKSVATHLIEMFGAHSHLYKKFPCMMLPKEPINSCECQLCNYIYPIVHWALDMGLDVTTQQNGKPLKRRLKNNDNNSFWTVFESEHKRRFGAQVTATNELERIMRSVQ